MDIRPGKIYRGKDPKTIHNQYRDLFDDRYVAWVSPDGKSVQYRLLSEGALLQTESMSQFLAWTGRELKPHESSVVPAAGTLS